MTTERSHAPSFPVCKLWEKTSAKGTVYLTGRLGGAKVVILPRREGDGDPADTSTHVMMFSEAAPYQPQTGQGRAQPAATRPATATAPTAQKPALDRRSKVQVEDDPVPF